jgi:curli biogenesis system outer membrane secretion channel CsgG
MFDGTPRVKTMIAVMDFENKAGFSGKWNLGEGMADLLNAALLESGRFTVLERQYLRDVVDELNLQGSDLFRPEQKVERGRLKNAHYLIRGSVTDFTAVGDASGWFVSPKARASIRSARTRVAVALRVVEVVNGEVVATVKAEADASSGGFGGAVRYQDVAFGGDVFFRTPLGKATEKAIARAVRQIERALPEREWQPRVAAVEGERAWINGGKNAGVKAGRLFLVRGPGRVLTDPVTGNVIDEAAGPVIGQLRVVEVGDTTAQAVIVDGRAARGDVLE